MTSFFRHRDENSNSNGKKITTTGNRTGSSIIEESIGVPLEYRLRMKDLEILKEAFDVNKKKNFFSSFRHNETLF